MYPFRCGASTGPRPHTGEDRLIGRPNSLSAHGIAGGREPFWVRHPSLASAGLIGLALGVRLAGGGRESYWFDELWAVQQVRPPLAELLADLRASDVHPPLYPILLWLWTRLGGEGEAWTRALSALAGAGATGAALGLLREWAGNTRPSLPLLGGALLALHPLLVDFGQETRAYSLLALTTLASAWALWRWAALPLSSARAAVAVLAATALVYSHVYGGFALAGQAAWALLSRQFSARSLALAGAAVALAFAPWIPVLLDQARRVQTGFWIGPLRWTDVPIALYAYGGYNPVTGLLLLAAAWVALAHPPRPHPPRLGSLLTWTAATPIALGVLASLLAQPIFVHKYAMGSVACLCVLAAIGLCAMRPPWRRRLIAATVVLMAANIAWLYVRTDKEQWRELAELARTRAAAGFTLMADEANRPYLPYYLGDTSVVWLAPPAGPAAREPADAASPGDATRLCLLMVHPPTSPWEDVFLPSMARSGAAVERWEGRLARMVCGAVRPPWDPPRRVVYD